MQYDDIKYAAGHIEPKSVNGLTELRQDLARTLCAFLPAGTSLEHPQRRTGKSLTAFMRLSEPSKYLEFIRSPKDVRYIDLKSIKN